VTGYDTSGDNRILEAVDLMEHLGEMHGATLGLAFLTIVIAVVLPKTRIGKLGRLVSIIVPSILVALLGLDNVQIVNDVGEIPRGIPTPTTPRFELWLDL